MILLANIPIRVLQKLYQFKNNTRKNVLENSKSYFENQIIYSLIIKENCNSPKALKLKNIHYFPFKTLVP